MTVLTLTKLWINRVDTGEGISAYSDPDRSQSFGVELQVRKYASGRLRSISVAGETGQLGFQITDVDLPTVVQLREWKGATVQVRDHRGQKWFGVFGEVDVQEYMDPARYAAAFTLQLVTVVEGV